MAATGTPTPNIGLRIPLGTDPASVDDINYNSNLIDTKLGAVGNDSVQDQIDDLNSNTVKYFGNPTSVTENIISITTGNQEVTLTYDGWYRCVLVNTSGEVNLRANGLTLFYRAEAGRTECIIPFKAGTVLKGTVTNSGGVYVHKYNGI